MPNSVWCAPVVSASAKTSFVSGSYTIVLVMPSGLMLPQGSWEPGIGSPTWVCQRTCPVPASSA